MGDIVTSMIKVTPAMASKFLESNSHNRRLDPTRVKTLAAAIRRGEWQETHQGVAFDAFGTLLDGQHRLAAIVESGAPVRMSVTTGLAPEAFTVIDTGRARRAGDILYMGGIKDGNHVAASLRLIDRYVRDYPRPWSSRRDGMTNTEILHAAQHWAEMLPPHAQRAREVHKRTGINRTGLTAAFFIAEQWALTYEVHGVDTWIEGLITGAELPVGDPRLALCNYLSGPYKTSVPANYRGEITMLATLRVFHLGIRDERLKILRILEPSMYMFHLPGFTADVMRSVLLDGASKEE